MSDDETDWVFASVAAGRCPDCGSVLFAEDESEGEVDCWWCTECEHFIVWRPAAPDSGPFFTTEHGADVIDSELGLGLVCANTPWSALPGGTPYPLHSWQYVEVCLGREPRKAGEP